MIQELFGGNHVSILGGGDRSTINNNLSNQILNPTHSQSSSPSPSPSSSNISTTTTTPTPAQNLRCPRCDSSNTKFCYYNNYNLTQPRHFCKTCRRYWTKGGALRNVPIGGGCRKNKTTTISSPGKSVSAPGKMIKTEHGKSPLFNGFDASELSTNPILWPSTHNSHLLSLLRANPNLNPNLNQNPNHISNHASSFIKDDGLMFGSSHHFPTNNGLNERAMGLDSFGGLQVSSLGLSNNNNNSYYNNRNQQQGIMFGEAENNGLQELYQRLRSTTNCYQENAPVIIGHVASGPSNSSSASILDSAPVVASSAGGNLLNPSLYWQLPTDQATANAAFP